MTKTEKDNVNMKKAAATILATALLGSLLAASVLTIGLRIAEAHECPAEGCAVGRMTGGGRLEIPDMIVTHGFELHCDVTDLPNNLEVNWDGGNRFHLGELTVVRCLDDPSIEPSPPNAGFDRYEAHGTGSYNGEDGATIYFEFTDAGEPGTNDIAFIIIHDAAGNEVLSVNASLDQGNHQAHKANK